MYSKRLNLLRLCMWASLLVACCGQGFGLSVQNPCPSKTTCSECVQTSSCAWCFQAEFNGPRCINPATEGGDTAGCNEAFMFNPDNQLIIDSMFNMELSTAKSRMGMASGSSSYEETKSAKGSFRASGGEMAAGAGAGETLVQMKPQRAKLNLRMNEMHMLKFAYSQAQDYPVDLYYLMDLSRPLKNDTEKLRTLGSLLSATMRNMTSNFRIGFGSIVPKKSLALAGASGNLDASGGGSDAIMQAVVCKQQIGWRDHAKRLLVFASDAGFLYAEDGKHGGIVQSNDGECHIENNSYAHSTLQDYPSISQINSKVKKHNINIIFAVTAEQTSMYEQVSEHIQGSSVGVLSNDPDNIVSLVKEQYNKIKSSVEMKDSSSDALQISYYSSCLGGKELIQTKKCENLKVGDVVEFTAEITLKECPKDRSKWRQTFEVSPVGISDSLVVELETICDCPCEHLGHPTCPGSCGEFKRCVYCEVHKRGENCGDCALFPIIEEGRIEAYESRNEHLCSFYDDEECLYHYVYSYNEHHQLVIRAQKKLECPQFVRANTNKG